ncbi:MAG: hypothetical protein C6I01_05895 [Epsilonproteobacteria bacterium]|nr:hypothetical protein [Campylobacterota bacterium]
MLLWKVENWDFQIILQSFHWRGKKGGEKKEFPVNLEKGRIKPLFIFELFSNRRERSSPFSLIFLGKFLQTP